MGEIQWQPSSPGWTWRTAADTGRPGGPPAAAAAAAARREGAIGGAVGLAVAAALAFLLHRAGTAVVVAAVAVAVALLAQAAPLTLYRRLRGGLERFGHWVGTGVTWVLLTLLFYLLFLPVGLLMRATGKLDLTRFADPALASYWTPTDGGVPAGESYRKQF
jgi:hypothetical protein